MVDTNQLLEHMLDCLLEIFAAERGQILLVDPKSGRFQMSIARKIDPKTGDYAISETIAREAIDRRVPILTTDALAEARYQGVDSIQREQIRSVVCVPLVRHKEQRPGVSTRADVLGVLYLDSRAAQKVFNNRELALLDTFAAYAVEAIEASREKDRLKKQVSSLQAVQRDQNLREHDFQSIVASNRKMVEVLGLVADVAKEEVTCLVLGESGTGKELIAKAIHYNSRRKDRPFVAVNCMALSPEIIESELFGHEKGSFTGASERRIGRFELADGGTLFLDEIGELSPNIQVKMLRVLQERQIDRVGGNRPVDVDVRLVAATHADLPKLLKTGRFREDLYYRLNVFSIQIPPLRQRMEDIPRLVEYFLAHFNTRMQRKLIGIDPEALSILMSYSWPGNIRELENVIERAFVVERQERISPASLPHDIVSSRGQGFASADLGVDNYPPDFHLAKELFEKNFILKYLRANGGNITATATQLGLPRKTIYRKLEAYQIPRDQVVDDGGPDDE
jgi:Nif-specific regulatory protein